MFLLFPGIRDLEDLVGGLDYLDLCQMGLKLKLQQTKSQLVVTNGKVNTDTDDQSGKKTSKTEKKMTF